MDDDYPETVTLTMEELEEIICHAIVEYYTKPRHMPYVDEMATQWAQYAFDAKRKQDEL